MNEAIRKCSDCGVDHQWQIDNYPEGAEVVVIGEFEYQSGLEKFIRVLPGTLGTISGHCSDGRAVVEFKDFGTHTFHFITDFIMTTKRLERGADDLPNKAQSG